MRPLRVFFIHAEPWTAPTVQALARRGIEVVLLVYRGKDGQAIYERAAPRAVLINSAEASFGTPPAMFADKVRAARAADLQHLLPHAVQILQMLERFNDRDRPTSEMYRLYLHIVGLWRSLLEELHPDAVLINGDIPHKGFDFVLHKLCELDGLPRLLFRGTLVNDRMMPVRDLDEVRGPDASELIGSVGEGPSHKVLSPAAEFVNSQANDMGSVRRKLTVRTIARGLIGLNQLNRMDPTPMFLEDPSPRHITMRLAKARGRWFGRRLLETYDSLVQQPSPQVPYVYCPLQVQPEATTSSMAGPLMDHVHVTRMISEARPPGWRIYVKEHPNQFNRGPIMRKARSEGYYRDLARIPGVTLVPLEVKGDQLIRHARTVVTIAGSSGWQSVKAGIPALVFGTPWYAKAPGVVRVTSMEECAAALQRVAVGDLRVSLDEVARYERILHDQLTVPLIAEQSMLSTLAITPEQHAETYAETVLRELAKQGLAAERLGPA